MKKTILLSLLLISTCSGYVADKPILGASLNPDRDLSRGLVAVWLFDDRPGVLGRAYDLSGNGFNMTMFGTVNSVPGKFGNALFTLGSDGDVDYAEIDKSPLTSVPYSIVIWFKCNENNPAADGTFFWVGDSGDGANYIRLNVTSDGFIRFWQRHSGGSIVTTTDYCDDKWHAVVATGEQNPAEAAGIMLTKLYVDGILVGTDADEFGPEITSTFNRIAFGANRDSTPNDPFHGEVDHCIIYNWALNAADVSSLFRDPFQMFRQERLPIAVAAAPAEVGRVIMIMSSIVNAHTLPVWVIIILVGLFVYTGRKAA